MLYFKIWCQTVKRNEDYYLESNIIIQKLPSFQISNWINRLLHKKKKEKEKKQFIIKAYDKRGPAQDTTLDNNGIKNTNKYIIILYAQWEHCGLITWVFKKKKKE